MPEQLTRAQRVRRRSVFRRIQRSAHKVHTRHFVIVVAPTPEDTTGSSDAPRLGLTVTKKVGNSPERNRVKRLVREVFRKNRECFAAQTDYVFIAKRGAPKLTYDDVLGEVVRAKAAIRKAAAASGEEAVEDGT